MVDVGASFGYLAVRCARAVGPNGMVHAFEPDPAVRPLLVANAAANDVDDRLMIHAAAVAERDGQVEFHLAGEASFSGLSATGRSPTRDVIVVPVCSLDSFAAEHRIEQISALKIDVEGHEWAVLNSAAALLRRSTDPLVMLAVSAKNLTDRTRVALDAVLDPRHASSGD